MRIHKSPDGAPVAFHDLPIEAFPVQLTAHLDGPDGEILWEETVEPYVMTKIPASRPEHRGRVWLEMETEDGYHYFEPPMSPEESRAFIEKEMEG